EAALDRRLRARVGQPGEWVALVRRGAGGVAGGHGLVAELAHAADDLLLVDRGRVVLDGQVAGGEVDRRVAHARQGGDAALDRAGAVGAVHARDRDRLVDRAHVVPRTIGTRVSRS